MQGTPENLINAEELAKRLGMARSHVYRMARHGKLPVYRVGLRLRGLRFDLAEVREALRRQPEEPERQV